MCGRYARPQSIDHLIAIFPGLVIESATFGGALFNVAPSQELPIVIHDGGARVVGAQWGLLPAWADPAKIKPQINARSEGIAEKPMFRSAFKARRCIIPAEGYYEWKAAGTTKRPYYFRLKTGEPFGFAGLWETGRDGLRNFAIITTDANDRAAQFHHRMPCILYPRDFMAWIDPADFDKDRLLALLAAIPSDDIDIYPVSRKVNNPRNDGADLLTAEEE